jgi:threonine dehydrogenase-like Zn-dependent dehydrogenase
MLATRLTADWDPRPGYSLTDEERTTRRARMACAVWRNPSVENTEVPDPELAAHTVAIRVRACGICGSDTHCIETDDDGYVIFSGPASFPCVLGHEFSGEVVAIGRSVRSVSLGDLVTSEGMLYCGTCEACRKGWFNQCRHLDMLGFSQAGALAEVVQVHEKHCWRIHGIAERLGDAQAACELAALVEPVGCSYNGIFVAGGGMNPGSHVAVFGCGPIGLGSIALARAAGAATITAFDQVPERLAVARTLGADLAHDVGAMDGTTPSAEIRRVTRGWGADLVVEAAGAAIVTMPQIEQALAPGATVVYLGRTGEKAPVMLDVLVSGASKIVGARGHAGGGIYPHIIRMLEHDRLNIAPMIDCRMPLDQAPAALERSRSRTDAKILMIQTA